MKTNRMYKAGAASMLALALLIGGETLSVPAQAAWGGVVVVEPPAPVVETFGRPPVEGYVWLGGYWDWVDGRHVWVPGHWSAPRRGYRWEPHAWVHGRDGWHLHEGHWVRIR